MEILHTKIKYFNPSRNTYYCKTFSNSEIKNNIHKIPLVVRGHKIVGKVVENVFNRLSKETRLISKNIGTECVLMSDGSIYTLIDMQKNLDKIDEILYSSYD